MAAEIKRATGVESQLIRSSGGVFEVTVDGDLIFSKKAAGHFPEESAILKAIARRSQR